MSSTDRSHRTPSTKFLPRIRAKQEGRDRGWHDRRAAGDRRRLQLVRRRASFPPTGGKWNAVVATPDGKILGVPWQVSSFVLIDPKALATFSLDLLTSAYYDKL